MAVGYTGSDFAIARYLGENVPQLDAFSLQTPFDQATAQNFASLPCNWTDAFGATSYEMEVDITPTFTSSPQIYTVGVSSKTLTNLTPNTQYFWRVRASDGSNWGAYSATCSFTTNSLDIFTHISPANNSVGTSFVNLTLDWTDLVGASSYEIELDSSQTFSMNPVVFTSIDSKYRKQLGRSNGLLLACSSFQRNGLGTVECAVEVHNGYG